MDSQRVFNVVFRRGQGITRIPCKYIVFCITTDAATLGVCGAFDSSMKGTSEVVAPAYGAQVVLSALHYA